MYSDRADRHWTGRRQIVLTFAMLFSAVLITTSPIKTAFAQTEGTRSGADAEELLNARTSDSTTEAEFEGLIAAHEEFLAVLQRTVDRLDPADMVHMIFTNPVPRELSSCPPVGFGIALDPRLVRQVPGISQKEIRFLSAINDSLSRGSSFDGLSEQTVSYLLFACHSTDQIYSEKQHKTVRSRLSATSLVRVEHTNMTGSAPSSPYSEAIRTTGKFSGRISDLSFALSARNDPGEPLSWRPGLRWYGFDHLAGFLRWAPSGKPIEITAGQYVVDFGQGILWSRPFGQRADQSAPHRSLRNSTGIRGNAASSNVSHLSGLGLTVRPAQETRLMIIFSQRLYDARPIKIECPSDCSSLAPAQAASAQWLRLSSDEHVTQNQREAKNAVRARLTGVVFEQSINRLHLGMSYVLTRFSHQFSWNGRARAVRSTRSASLAGTWTTSRVKISGEWSFENSDVAGRVLGIVFKPDRRLRGIILYRSYDSRRIGLHSAGIGFSSSLIRQWGLLAGWRYLSDHKWVLAASVDFKSGTSSQPAFFGPRYQIDTRIYAEIRTLRLARIRLRIRQKRLVELFDDLSGVSNGLSIPEVISVEQISGELLYNIPPSLKIRLRVDANVAHTGGYFSGSGFLAYQQLEARVSEKYRVSLRTSIFEIDDPLNRIFVYEPDVSGKLIAPSVSGNGYQLMVLMRITTLHGTMLELKVSHRVARKALQSIRPDQTMTRGKYGFQQSPIERDQITLQVVRRF